MSKLVLFLSITLIILSFLFFKQCRSERKEDSVEVIHNMVLEKVEAIGKIELVKYYLKDVVEYKERKDWLPDPRVILLVSGEVVGCIDLAKLDSSDITITPEQVMIRLPSPEICYYKVNHKDSKVYHVENHMLRQVELIDKAYKQAEKQLNSAALEAKILRQTNENAITMLKPLLEALTGKKVVFQYDNIRVNRPKN